MLGRIWNKLADWLAPDTALGQPIMDEEDYWVEDDPETTMPGLIYILPPPEDLR